ncbi:hypothetical protein FQZ97_1065670 [compost metagenome]
MAAEVVGGDQRCQQQHGGELHGHQVRAEQADTDGLGVHRGVTDAGAARSARQHQQQLDQQQRGKRAGTDPDAGLEPLALLFGDRRSEVEHHHHEDEQHHDRAGVDDDLQGTRERRAEAEEHHGNRQQRDDQIQQGVHRVGTGDHPQGGHHGNACREIESEFHAYLLRAAGSSR